MIPFQICRCLQLNMQSNLGTGMEVSSSLRESHTVKKYTKSLPSGYLFAHCSSRICNPANLQCKTQNLRFTDWMKYTYSHCCFLPMQPLFSLDLILPKAQAPSHSHRWFHWAAARLASWEINCQVTGSQWEDHPAPQVLHLTQLCNKISGFARWGQKLDAEYSSFCSLLLSLIFRIRVIMSEINPNLPAFFQVTT